MNTKVNTSKMCTNVNKSCRRMCENIRENHEITTEIYNQVYQKMLNNVEFLESLSDDQLLSKKNKTFVSQLKQFQRDMDDLVFEYQLKFKEMDILPIINSNNIAIDTANTTVSSISSLDNTNIKNETITIAEIHSSVNTDIEQNTVQNEIRSLEDNQNIDTNQVLTKCATFSYQEYLSNRTSEDELLAQKFSSMSRSSSVSSYKNFAAENTLSRNHSSSFNINIENDTSSRSISFKTCSDDASFSNNLETNTSANNSNEITICVPPTSEVEANKNDIESTKSDVHGTKNDVILKNEHLEASICEENFNEQKKNRSSSEKLNISTILENNGKLEKAHCSQNSNGYLNIKLVKKIRAEVKEVEDESSMQSSSSNCTLSGTVPKNTRRQNPLYKCLELANQNNTVKCDKEKNEAKELKNKPAPTIGQRCYISFARSPSEFYITTYDSYFVDIERLTQEIHEVFDPSMGVTYFETKTAAKAAIQNCCIAYVDEEWCRAEIVDWYQNDTSDVEIFLVDYGYNETVHYNHLRKMLEYFTEIPKFAQKCHLANITPKNNNKWSEEACKILCFYSDYNQVFTINYVKQEGDSYAVELISEEDDTNIAFELFKAGETKLLEDKEIVKESFMLEQLKNAIGVVSDYDDYDDDEDDKDLQKLIECRNINEAIIGYNPRDGLRYCDFVRPDGTCFKGDNCKLEHDPQAKEMLRNIITLDRAPCRTFRNMSDVLECVGDEVDLIVTCIISTKKFYAHIRDVPGRQQFIRNMNLKPVVNRYGKISPGEVLSVGEAVIAFIENDNAWYRAMIRSIDYCQEEYEVFLIDFGEVYVCKKKNLRNIPDIFFEFPPQAIECHLINVTIKSDVDQSQAVEYFENIALEKSFHANVFYKENLLAVKLTNNNGEDIGQKLVEAGYADFENEIIVPSSKEHVLVD